MDKNIKNYVLSQDITNHLQVKDGDLVTISKAAWTQMSREKHFLTTIVVGGTLTACTMGLATGFVGMGIVGSEIAMGVTAAEIGVASGAIGGTAAAIGHKLTTDAAVAAATLETMPFIGRVKRVDNKLFSELKHVEIEFFIPQTDGTYVSKSEWIDAHHLMKVITKDENEKRTQAAQQVAMASKRKYDAELLKKHRTQFAPENVQLSKELEEAKTQRTVFASILAFAPFLLLI